MQFASDGKCHLLVENGFHEECRLLLFTIPFNSRRNEYDNVVGSLTCDLLSVVGAEDIVEKSCSNPNTIYGIGLVSLAALGLLALGLFFFWDR